MFPGRDLQEFTHSKREQIDTEGLGFRRNEIPWVLVVIRGKAEVRSLLAH